MPATQIVAQLTEFEGRGAGTDAERRAAQWLRAEMQSPRRAATIETFWCRPNWALAHGWHALVAIAGSLVMVSNAIVGGALVLVTLLSILADWLTGRSLGRRLTAERASQNVVGRPLAAPDRAADPVASTTAEAPIHLIVTANYDAGRAGLVYRRELRRATALPRRLAADGRLLPGWQGWLVIAHAWLLVVAVLRHLNDSVNPGGAVGILQLIPTVVLVLYLALLVELAVSDVGPAAADNAAGTAVALALVRALDAAPPRRLSVELVLQGAGDGQMIGLSRHLRRHRRELSARNAIVLGIGPLAGGRSCWWTGDGSLLPLRFHRRLGELAQHLAPGPAGLDACPHRGRGTSPALPARTVGIPAINIGRLENSGHAASSHTPQDTADALDAQALDGILQFALVLVDAIDADLVRRGPATPAAPPARAPDEPASTAARLSDRSAAGPASA